MCSILRQAPTVRKLMKSVNPLSTRENITSRQMRKQVCGSYRTWGGSCAESGRKSSPTSPRRSGCRMTPVVPACFPEGSLLRGGHVWSMSAVDVASMVGFGGQSNLQLTAEARHHS